MSEMVNRERAIGNSNQWSAISSQQESQSESANTEPSAVAPDAGIKKMDFGPESGEELKLFRGG
jgi:hypothetical protein